MEFPRWKVKVSALRTTALGKAHATTKDLRIRKPGTQENGISEMESKSLRGNRTRAEPSEFSTDFVLFC